MSLNKILAGVLALQIVVVGTMIVMPAQTRTQPASALYSDKSDGDCIGNETAGRCADKPLLFDHSQCQYPNRWTNPVDSCDNSDPAVPECIKEFDTEANEKACIDRFVKQNTEAQPEEPVQWEGK